MVYERTILDFADSRLEIIQGQVADLVFDAVHGANTSKQETLCAMKKRSSKTQNREGAPLVSWRGDEEDVEMSRWLS